MTIPVQFRCVLKFSAPLFCFIGYHHGSQSNLSRYCFFSYLDQVALTNAFSTISIDNLSNVFFFGNNNPNLRPSSAIIWEIASKIFLRPKCVTRFPLLSYITWLNYGKSVPTARSNIASKFTVSLLTELFSLDFPLDPNVDPHCTGFSSLLYILNLPKLSRTTKQKSPNMGKK